MWLEIVLACAVLVLVVALAAVLLQVRGIRERTSAAIELKERPHGILDAYDARYSPGDGFVAFDVPNEPDLCLMFGRAESIEASGAEVVHSVPGSLARAAVGLDALAKAGIEVGQQAGMLVRLTKKSTQAYREGRKLIDSSGAAMGVVQNSSGKFRHVLRFKPATGVQMVSSATGVLSAIAMQAQLASIEHAIAEVAADVIHIERTQENLISSEMKAVDGLLRETYNAATTSGELTDVMWDQISGIAVLVRKHDELSAMQLADITRELEQQKSVKDRRAWLRKNRARLRERLAAAQHSGVLSSRYGALRLWRLIEKDDPSRDFYTQVLRSEMQRRESLVGDLVDGLKRSIESASTVTRFSQVHSPLDSRAVKALIAEVGSNFETATGMSLSDAFGGSAQRDQIEVAPVSTEELPSTAMDGENLGEKQRPTT